MFNLNCYHFQCSLSMSSLQAQESLPPTGILNAQREAENSVNGVGERENDPPLSAIASTPVANVSDPEAAYHAPCVVLAEPIASTMSF